MSLRDGHREGVPNDLPPRVRPGTGKATFWTALSDDERRELAVAAQLTRLTAGSVVWRETEPANDVIVILVGWMKVSLEEDREHVIALRGPGDLVGERAALQVPSRSAAVVALSDVEVLLVPAAAFAQFLGANPQVTAVLERLVYERLTESHGIRHDRNLYAVERQLASALMDLATRYGRPDGAFSVPVSEDELASWLNAPTEPVRLVLNGWQDRGIAQSLPGSVTILRPPELARIVGPAQNGERGPSRKQTTASRPGIATFRWSGQNCSVLFTDIASFTDTMRNGDDRRVIRQAMYVALRESFEECSMPWDHCYREDRGDGALVVIPPSVPTSRLVDPLVGRLASRLRRHNRQAAPSVRLQLRVALHVGRVTGNAEGVSGEAAIHAARLLDCQALKSRLVSSAADVGFIASEFVYDMVIRNAPGDLDPEAFDQVKVRVKETRAKGWILVAGKQAQAPRPLDATKPPEPRKASGRPVSPQASESRATSSSATRSNITPERHVHPYLIPRSSK